jgi:hypothetical protein
LQFEPLEPSEQMLPTQVSTLQSAGAKHRVPRLPSEQMLPVHDRPELQSPASVHGANRVPELQTEATQEPSSQSLSPSQYAPDWRDWQRLDTHTPLSHCSPVSHSCPGSPP